MQYRFFRSTAQYKSILEAFVCRYPPARFRSCSQVLTLAHFGHWERFMQVHSHNRLRVFSEELFPNYTQVRHHFISPQGRFHLGHRYLQLLEVMNTKSNPICTTGWGHAVLILIKYITSGISNYFVDFIPQSILLVYIVLKANILFNSYKGPFFWSFQWCYCLSHPVRALKCHRTLQQFTAQTSVHFTNIIWMRKCAGTTLLKYSL